MEEGAVMVSKISNYTVAIISHSLCSKFSEPRQLSTNQDMEGYHEVFDNIAAGRIQLQFHLENNESTKMVLPKFLTPGILVILS